MQKSYLMSTFINFLMPEHLGFFRASKVQGMHFAISKAREAPKFSRTDRVTSSMPDKTLGQWGSSFPSHCAHLLILNYLPLRSTTICYTHMFIHITNGVSFRSH